MSPADHPNTLRLSSSKLNLTALNGNYAGPEGQTFVGRRQQDTLFTYSVDLDFHPTVDQEEAGVSVFLTQNHHLDLGVVLLAATGDGNDTDELVPHLRFRGESDVPVPEETVFQIPDSWRDAPLRLEIRASNMTHYALSAGPAGAMSELKTIVDASNDAVSWGFTGKHGFTLISLSIHIVLPN